MAQKNEVQFSWHANERIFGRYKQITNYALIQQVLQNKPLRNGVQKVNIARFPCSVKVEDETARNGKYIQGTTLKAVVEVSNDNEVIVMTITLE